MSRGTVGLRGSARKRSRRLASAAFTVVHAFSTAFLAAVASSARRTRVVRTDCQTGQDEELLEIRLKIVIVLQTRLQDEVAVAGPRAAQSLPPRPVELHRARTGCLRQYGRDLVPRRLERHLQIEPVTAADRHEINRGVLDPLTDQLRRPQVTGDVVGLVPLTAQGRLGRPCQAGLPPTQIDRRSGALNTALLRSGTAAHWCRWPRGARTAVTQCYRLPRIRQPHPGRADAPPRRAVSGQVRRVPPSRGIRRRRQRCSGLSTARGVTFNSNACSSIMKPCPRSGSTMRTVCSRRQSMR